MHGGELYVKKIPSMRMPELAAAIAPNLKTVEVGIRPGEKIHECMITREDARNTIERDGYYIILPQIQRKSIDEFYKNDKRVPDDFEYSSGNNTWWLTVDEMRKLIAEL